MHKIILVGLCLLWSSCLLFAQVQVIFDEGVEANKWEPLTLQMTGPSACETDGLTNGLHNPFSDYNVNVIWTKGSKTYTVPGYFAADGNAANTGATCGDRWQAHFTPDEAGTWNYSIRFYAGTDVALDIHPTQGTTVAPHNATGSIVVQGVNTGLSARDNRVKGRLQYVGEHYLRFAESQAWFFKGGADAPENTLAYDDFDATPDVPANSSSGSRFRKSWQPHSGDYQAADAAAYTWQSGKGQNLLGALRYLGDLAGVNAFSFLTFSAAGDDQNVFPHLLKVPMATYETYVGGNQSTGRRQQWTQGLHHDRFDVSKLAQWEKIFSYGDKKGLFMHFKLYETENDNLMDGNTFGPETQLYLREMVARFQHHLALNWNLGEEITISNSKIRDMANYVRALDAYDHHLVLSIPVLQSEISRGLRYNWFGTVAATIAYIK